MRTRRGAAPSRHAFSLFCSFGASFGARTREQAGATLRSAARTRDARARAHKDTRARKTAFARKPAEMVSAGPVVAFDLQAYDLYKKMEVLRPKPSSDAEMTKFHSDEYVKFMKNVTPDNYMEPRFRRVRGIAICTRGSPRAAGARLNPHFGSRLGTRQPLAPKGRAPTAESPHATMHTARA